VKRRLHKSHLRAVEHGSRGSGTQGSGATPLQWPAARTHPAAGLAGAKLRRWAPMVLATAGLITVAMLAVFRLPWRLVTEVAVLNSQYVNGQTVLDSARVRIGSPLYELDMDSVALRVLGIRWVKGLEITRRFSGRVEISVEERQPVGMVVTSRGTALLDAEGYMQPLRGNIPPDLPLITGLTEVGENRRLRLHQLATLLAEVADISPLNAVVSEIHDAYPGMTVMLLSPKGTPVLLPRTVGRNRLVTVASVVQQHPRVLLDAQYLDARFAGRVAAKS